MADFRPKQHSDRAGADQSVETLAFVDGALGAAGHRVDDETTRDLLRQQAAGEITADEAIAEPKRRERLA